MADKTELEILLTLADKASGPMGKVGASMRKFGASAMQAGKAMTASLTLPIVSLGSKAVGAFSEFEAGMASVSTLVDTSTESMEDMSKQVLEIGKNIPVGFDELTGALFDVRSAGIGSANAMNVLERSAQLGVAGLGSTQQAAKLAAGAINAWGLEGKQADDIFNTIFLTTADGITTIAGLEQGFGAVAGKMANAGIAADDYFAAVGALTTTTLKAAEAHTQMKAAVDGLEKGGKKTSKVFRRLGVKDFKQLVTETGSVTKAFRKVKEAVGDKSGALKDLIGSSEGAAAVMALVGTQGDKQEATLEKMRKKTEGLTAVQIAANKQNKTAAAQWKMTKNKLEATAISIGQKLVPILLKVAEKLSAVVDWFSGLSEGTQEFILIIAGVVAILGPAITVFGALATAFGFVSTALGIMSAVIAANPIIFLIMAIALAALAIYENWDDIAAFFTLLWDSVKADFDAASTWIANKMEDITSSIKNFALENEGTFSFLSGAAGAVPALLGDALLGDAKDEKKQRDLRVTETAASKLVIEENANRRARNRAAGIGGKSGGESILVVKMDEGLNVRVDKQGPDKIDLKQGVGPLL